MKNLKEFNELIERYETIQLDEIENAWNIYFTYSNKKLTGFGDFETCKLCIAVTFIQRNFCSLCVYGTSRGCVKGSMHETYREIVWANKPTKLLQAYRNRAKAMREFLTNKLQNGENV